MVMLQICVCVCVCVSKCVSVYVGQDKDPALQGQVNGDKSRTHVKEEREKKRKDA